MNANLAREFIFTDDRPFVSCHASTILTVSDRSILAAWFAGPREGHADVAIWTAARAADGTWTPPLVIADEPGVPHWNPVLAKAPNGNICLFYKVGDNCSEWRTRMLTSSDGGTTWGTFEELTPVEGFPVGPVKNKPIILSDGTWAAPTSLETASRWDAAVTLSRDNGRNWHLGGPVPVDHGTFSGKGVIQPTLWESEPGVIHMLLRSTEGWVFRSDSVDGGRTWTHAYATELPNNNSGIDVVKTESGRLALAHNPISVNWGKRTPLVVALSSDNGRSWPETIVIEDEDTHTGEVGISLDRPVRPNEFSYPAIIEDDGKLLISYTWKRERIALVTLGTA